MTYRADIDGLRGVAIISVVFFHLDFKHFSGGFIGVDVFFVISGFLITNVIKNEYDQTNTFNLKNFYLRRVRRLFPALFVTLFLTTIAACLLMSPMHLSRFGGALSTALISVSNFYFWLEADYFDVSAKLKPLLHTWSLSIEEQFYILWPSMLLLLLKLKSKIVLPIFLFIAIIGSLIINSKFSDGSVGVITLYLPRVAEWIKEGQATIFFLLPFRIFEFSIGALLVWAVRCKLQSRNLHDLILIAGLGMIAYAGVNFDKSSFSSPYNALIPALGTVLIIYSGNQSRLTSILDNPVFVGIGLISYSLYLIHWPIIVFWNYFDSSLSITAIIAIILLSTSLAALSYTYIEQPFRQKKVSLKTLRSKSLVFASVMFLGFAGISMKSNNGWNWRIPSSPVVLESSETSSDFHREFFGGAGYSGPIHTKEPADIVLMGDSHGHHYAEGIYKVLALPYNLNLYVSAGSSFIHLPNFMRFDPPELLSPQTTSRIFSEEIEYIKEVQQSGHQPIVFLSESWLFQMDRADLLDTSGDRRNIHITKEIVLEGILSLKKLIGESTLIVIGRVPAAGVNLYDIFTRPRAPFMPSFNIESYFTSTPDKEAVEFNNYLKKHSLLTKKFTFLDPHNVLCDGNECNNLNEEMKLIYSDSMHLSKDGSVEVIKGFMPKILPLINSKGGKVTAFDMLSPAYDYPVTVSAFKK